MLASIVVFFLGSGAVVGAFKLWERVAARLAQRRLNDRLRDVGPTTSRLLTRLGIRTVRDLLLTLPFRCETYAPSPISALAPGRAVLRTSGLINSTMRLPASISTPAAA